MRTHGTAVHLTAGLLVPAAQRATGNRKLYPAGTTDLDIPRDLRPFHARPRRDKRACTPTLVDLFAHSRAGDEGPRRCALEMLPLRWVGQQSRGCVRVNQPVDARRILAGLLIK